MTNCGTLSQNAANTAGCRSVFQARVQSVAWFSVCSENAMVRASLSFGRKCHPSIFFRLSVAGSRGHRSKLPTLRRTSPSWLLLQVVVLWEINIFSEERFLQDIDLCYCILDELIKTIIWCIYVTCTSIGVIHQLILTCITLFHH